MLKPTVYTKSPSIKTIKREVVFFDAKNQKLGRLATQIATKLIGKHKVNYVTNLDMGDYVVVTNCLKLDLGYKKLESKTYNRYSGYQSGQKTTSLSSMWAKEPTLVIKLAVKGMLPDNKLKRERLKRLFIYTAQDYNLPRNVAQLAKKNS